MLVKNTAFKEVGFTNCKLVGIDFSICNPFLLEFAFTNCDLNLVSFYQLTLKNTLFKNCNLKETDLTESDLSQSVFDNCDFNNAIFERTNLEKANLKTSYNYILNPENNKLAKAKLSAQGALGLLHKYNLIIDQQTHY